MGMAATEGGFRDGLGLVRPLDEEQGRLVDILLAARGADVSFEELRRQGIESPAVLAYELEIAGLPIAHVQRLAPGDARPPSGCVSTARSPGTRVLRSAPTGAASSQRARTRHPCPRRRFACRRAPPPRAAADCSDGDRRRRARRDRGLDPGQRRTGQRDGPARKARPRGLKPGGDRTVGGHGHAHAGCGQPPAPHPCARPPSRAGQTGTSAEPGRAAAARRPPALAEGRYAAAIPELRAALGASGESASNCNEPSTPGCVAYAEALYDLGRALRLDNASAAAGAVLRERLQINSQREAVRHELGLNSRHRARTRARQRTTHAGTPRGQAKPAPAPRPHSNTGGAAAPAPTQAPTRSGAPGSGHGGSQQPSTPGGSTAP